MKFVKLQLSTEIIRLLDYQVQDLNAQARIFTGFMNYASGEASGGGMERVTTPHSGPKRKKSGQKCDSKVVVEKKNLLTAKM